MKAKKGLCILGGFMMLISVFLPVFYSPFIYEHEGSRENGSVYYWMFGFYQKHYSYGREWSGILGEQLDLLGILCMVIILIGAIIILATSGKDSMETLFGGVIGVAMMLFYFYGVYFGSILSPMAIKYSGYIPYFGFYLCLGGGVLSILGTFFEKLKTILGELNKMPRKILSLSGGFIMLISVFFPVFFHYDKYNSVSTYTTVLVYYWMFGHLQGFRERSNVHGTYYYVGSGFMDSQLDLLGIICMGIIIFGGIIAILKVDQLTESEKKINSPLIGGIMGLLGMLVYVFGVFFGLSPMSNNVESYFLFLGFYFCLSGAILIMIGNFVKS